MSEHVMLLNSGEERAGQCQGKKRFMNKVFGEKPSCNDFFVVCFCLLCLYCFVFGFFKTAFLIVTDHGCPGTCFVDQADFKFMEICLPLLPSSGIKGMFHHAQPGFSIFLTFFFFF